MVQLVGILNVTPDSFSDGGQFNDPNKATHQAQTLIDQGANIIDIGGESTRPGAMPISALEEWERIKDVLPEIIALTRFHVKVSLDSRHPAVIKRALEMGIDIVNDVGSYQNEELVKLIARLDKKIILMHNLSIPADKSIVIDENLDEIEEIKKWARTKMSHLQKLGIKKHNIIFDPGIGFGKNAHQSANIINHIEQFKDLGLEIFVGHSRKSFLSEFNFQETIDRTNSDQMTLAVSKALVKKGVNYLRVHNIEIHAQLNKGA